jgi:hypothetical protein
LRSTSLRILAGWPELLAEDGVGAKVNQQGVVD